MGALLSLTWATERQRMRHTFQIAPTNNIVIEWKADLPGARWCFYMVTDSPNEAKRILSVLMPNEQPMLLEVNKL